MQSLHMSISSIKLYWDNTISATQVAPARGTPGDLQGNDATDAGEAAATAAADPFEQAVALVSAASLGAAGPSGQKPSAADVAAVR